MKKSFKIFLALLLAIVVTILSVHVVLNAPNIKSDPVNNNGEKWRIGYYEGGPYVDYFSHLISFINGLVNSGWIEDINLTEFSASDSEK